MDKKFNLGTQFIPVSKDSELVDMFTNLTSEALNLNFRTDAELKKVINDYVDLSFKKSIYNFEVLGDVATKSKKSLKQLKNSDFEIIKINNKFSTTKLKKISEKTIKNEASKVLAVFDSFYADIKKNVELGTLAENKDSLEARAEIINEVESSRLTNEANKQLAVADGFDSWVWGASDNENTREEHEQYYGEVFDINEVPDVGLPAEAPNCGCQIIFIKSA